MPKIVKPLTASTVANLKPKAKRYSLSDGHLTGLSILVLENGTKGWRLKYKTEDGEEKRVSLGVFPNISLAEARDAANKWKSEGNKEKQKVLTTIKEVSDKFIVWKTSVSRSPATIRKYNECLSNHILPEFGKRSIDNLHTPEVVIFLEKINERSNSLANKNKELLSMIVKFAIQRGYRPPYSSFDLSGIVTRQASREKRMIEPKNIPWKNISLCRSIVMQHCIKIQFLCFLRASEIMGSQWNEIDLKNATWTIPASRMKMKRIHIVPLAGATIDLLNSLKKLTGQTPFLFPSLHNERHMVRDSLSKIFRDLDLGLHPHACRTLAATWMRNAGYAPHVVESQLSHVESNQIAAAYMNAPHLIYLEERKKMMQSWADHLLNKKTLTK